MHPGCVLAGDVILLEQQIILLVLQPLCTCMPLLLDLECSTPIGSFTVLAQLLSIAVCHVLQLMLEELLPSCLLGLQRWRHLLRWLWHLAALA